MSKQPLYPHVPKKRQVQFPHKPDYLKSPIIHEVISQNPDPAEYMPLEVNSAFPEGAKSNLNSQERAQVDRLIEEVPDENDTLAINYWTDMGDKKVYLRAGLIPASPVRVSHQWREESGTRKLST